MSLLIIGSCSKITSNIIHALAKQKSYESITIADPLPQYNFHQRYYKLRKTLNDQRSTTPVTLDRIINIEELSKHVNSHRDILHITHDYFASVTSKLKLMDLTANLSKNKSNVLYAAPIQYDQYGEEAPEQSFLDAKENVLKINPNANFIRSDVQDASELYAYLYKSKNIWEEQLLKTPDSFRPKVVKSAFFTEKVVEQLSKASKGEDIVIRGDKERHYTEVAHNKDIQNFEMDHQAGNIRLMVGKYRGPEDRHGTILISKSS